jgi:hypothetical protein
MKKLYFYFLFLAYLGQAQVGINTTFPNAMLDVDSTNNGVLIPRVNLTSVLDNTTIVNPQGGALVTSTIVYNMTAAGASPNNVLPGFYYWNNVQSRWIPIGGTNDWSLNGNTGINSPATPAVYGTSTIAATENFIGTTDNNALTIGTNSIERMRVLPTGNIGIGMATAPAKLSVQSIFSSPTIPNTTTNAFLRIGSNNEGLDFGKASTAGNFAGWLQSGFSGSPDPLSLQPLGGSVGVGTTNPSLARFQVDGMIGNTTGLFRNNATSQGLSLVADWPGIYFNSYYNGGIRSMAGTGFASIINTDQASGGLLFQTTNTLNPAANSVIASIPIRMTITGTGNVGINQPNPTQKLHVIQNESVNKSVILSEASQPTTGADYQNIAVQGIGRGVSSWGYATGVMGIGDTTSGFYATGVHAHLGTATPTSPSTDQALYANGNGLGRAAVFTGGNIVIQDGTQGNGRVLTSNATGVATWQNVGIDNIVGNLSASGVNIPYNTGPYLQTGSSITLPPGRYAVNVNMLMSKFALTFSPNNSFFWVRSTFSDSAGAGPTPSPDIVGSTLASGNYPGTSIYSMLIGTIIINNTTAGNKTYYYVAGNCVFGNTTETLYAFGSSYWAENNIIAYRLN